MAADFNRRSSKRDFKVQRFHLQCKSIEIIGEAVKNISYHDRLCADRDDTFCQTVTIIYHHKAGSPPIVDFLQEVAKIRLSFYHTGILIQTNRTHCHRAVIELLALPQHLQCTQNAFRRAQQAPLNRDIYRFYDSQ